MLRGRLVNFRTAILIIVGIISIIFLWIYIYKNNTEKSKADTQNINLTWKKAQDLLSTNEILAPQPILQATLHYTKNQRGTNFTIKSLKRLQGYPKQLSQRDKNEGTYFTIELRDQASQIIKTTDFKINNVLITETLSDPPQGKAEEINDLDVVINMEWDDSASYLTVKNNSGAQILRSNLTNVQEINNTPDYETITGSEVNVLLRKEIENVSDQKIESGRESEALNPELSELQRQIIKRYEDQKALINNGGDSPTNDGYFDFVIVSDKYAQSELNTIFAQEANNIVGFASTQIDPFKSRYDQIRYHRLNNLDSLCNYINGTWTCSPEYVIAVVNHAAVPWDGIFVLIDSGSYGGSAYLNSRVGGASNATFYRTTFIHEMGHAVGGVYDEYNYNSYGDVNHQVHHHTCYAGVPLNDFPGAWDPYIAKFDVRRVCGLSNYYRPTADSVMKTSWENPFFDKPGIDNMNMRITEASTNSTDNIYPNLTILSPQQNATIQGVVPVNIQVSDNRGVYAVEYLLDGNLFHTQYKSPFNFSISSRTLTVGQHTLTVAVRDASGNTRIQWRDLNVLAPPSPTGRIRVVITDVDVPNLFIDKIQFYSYTDRINPNPVQVSRTLQPGQVHTHEIPCYPDTKTTVGVYAHNSASYPFTWESSDVLCGGNTEISINNYVFPQPTVSQAPTSIPAPSQITPSPPIPTAPICSFQSFVDVPPDPREEYLYVQCVSCRNVINSPIVNYQTGERRFSPGEFISRATFAEYITKAAGFFDDIPNGRQTFADVPYVPLSQNSESYYKWLFIERAFAHNLIGGYPCGSNSEPCDGQRRSYYRPNYQLTRGQFAKLVSTGANYTNEIPNSRQTFTDIPPDSSFWAHVERLRERNILGGYSCGGTNEPCDAQNRQYFRVGSSVTRFQAAKILSGTFLNNCNMGYPPR